MFRQLETQKRLITKLGQEVTQYAFDRVKKDQFNLQTEKKFQELIYQILDYPNLNKKSEQALERIQEILNNRNRRALNNQKAFEFEENKKPKVEETLKRRKDESESE